MSSFDNKELKRGFNKLAQEALKIPTAETIRNAFDKKFEDAGFDVRSYGDLFEVMAQNEFVAVTGNKNGTLRINYNNDTTPNERSLAQVSDELAEFYARNKNAPQPRSYRDYPSGGSYMDGHTM